MTYDEFIDAFKIWISSLRDYSVLEPCAGEYFRYKLNKGNKAVLFKAPNGSVYGNALAEKHLSNFRKSVLKRGESVLPPKPRATLKDLKGEVKGSSRRVNLIGRLLNRDGENCFFCGQPLTHDDVTLEHLVPQAHDGPNNHENLVLAHARCNQYVSDLPAGQKAEIKAALVATPFISTLRELLRDPSITDDSRQKIREALRQTPDISHINRSSRKGHA